jgi:hypothetical protein
VNILNQMTETHRIRDLAAMISEMTGTPVQFLDNPRNEASENDLHVANDRCCAWGLEPITLRDGLLREVTEVARRYADRCDRSKIPSVSLWREAINRARLTLACHAQRSRHRAAQRTGPIMLNVGVIGTGYVGLVTGACLSELGHNVVCVDTDVAKISRLQDGEIPIYEPGLEELVATNASRGLLSFTTDINDAVAHGINVLFIAVGTPTDGNGGGANLGYVFAAVEQAARALAAVKSKADQFTVIVTKSTVPVGTSRKVAAIMAGHIPAERFAVASNPEFLREGNAIEILWSRTASSSARIRSGRAKFSRSSTCR